MMRCLFGVSALGAVAGLAMMAMPAAASTLQNGDFSSGLDGFQIERCAITCGPDGTNSAAVVDPAGGNPYLALKAPTHVFGSGQIEASQTVHITPSASLLRFDVGLTAIGSDVQTSATTLLVDFFSLLLQLSPTEIYSFGFYDVNGARPSPLDALTGPKSITPTTLSNMPGALSAFAFSLDMTQFMGRDVDLIFSVVSRNDSRVTTFGIDNITLTGTQSGTPTVPVPLPAGGVLLLSALGAIAGMRHLKGRARRA